jgi:hypothetical protein
MRKLEQKCSRIRCAGADIARVGAMRERMNDERTLVETPEPRHRRPRPTRVGPAMNRAAATPRPALSIGTQVEVHNRFCASWSRGFEVAETTRGGYRLRRQSDRYVLPAEFVANEVRPQGRRVF